jgi:hypothetical protein
VSDPYLALNHLPNLNPNLNPTLTLPRLVLTKREQNFALLAHRVQQKEQDEDED